MIKKELELMCPAGSYESLIAAIKAGAGSVYFGVGNLNMRSRSAKFSINDLKKVAKICRDNGVKSYLTVNTVLFDDDLKDAKKICNLAKKTKITAIIACDLAVIQYARKIDLEIHMSTQANISNIEAVKFYSKFADAIVLARELSLKQVEKICKQIKNQKIKGPNGKLVKVEVFVHGAMCVSISGKCYMSLATYNHSANRGACFQNCRRKYRVIDQETGDELLIDNECVMSPKDMCTIGIMDKLIKAGVSIFKIEGRARSEEYVYTVTKTYKEAIDSVINKTYSKNKIDKWLKELKHVFNRGFWINGYYLGKTLGEWANTYGSQATKTKVIAGKVIHFFDKKGIAQLKLQAKSLKLGDNIMISGPTTGVVFTKVKSIFDSNANPIKIGEKGTNITIPISEKVRINDKIYIIYDK